MRIPEFREEIQGRPISRVSLDLDRRAELLPTSSKWYTGIKFVSTEKTSNYTVTDSDLIIYVDATSSPATITLPAATDSGGHVFYIKKVDSSGNTVTIDADGTETIDGEQTIEMNLQYQCIMVHCDGTEWFILGGEYVKMEDLLKRYLGEQTDLLERIEKNTNDTVSQLERASDEEREEKE